MIHETDSHTCFNGSRTVRGISPGVPEDCNFRSPDNGNEGKTTPFPGTTGLERGAVNVHGINKTEADPIDPAGRIGSLDILRGFAVLGILVMNIQAFAMIEAAYFNPTAYGDLNGANWTVWLYSHIFADMKFISLFSLLFGAGVLLFTDRVETKGAGAARLHYRRTLWLLLFGILHGYLLWFGDILFIYGICALLVFPFRRFSPVKLLIIGLLVVSVSSGLYLLIGQSMHYMPPEAVESMSREIWTPDAAAVAAEIEAYRGSYAQQLTHRAPSFLMMQTSALLLLLLWRAGGLMLIGMALLKWGVLSAKRSNRFYLLMFLLGFGIGIPLILYGVSRHIEHGWTFPYSFFIGTQYNYWGSLFIVAAYIGIIMLAVRLIGSSRILTPLAVTGRMAFSNYILQTLICTTIFYGHGFGLFGSVERTGQIMIVLLIWIFQILVSLLWLKYFRFGPLEWLWRSLTYLKLQPLRRA
jgi:uncharacterized protein